jgi:hypothetical protein
MEKKAAPQSLAQRLDQYGGMIALAVCLIAVILLLTNR